MDPIPKLISGPEHILVCPYNVLHCVSAKNMQFHLEKCRQLYVGQEHVQCPINAEHVVPRVELPFHISQCPDRAVSQN